MLVAGVLVLATVLGRDRLVDAFVDRKARSRFAAMDRPIGLGHGLHVVLCGTGTPQSDADRGPPCLAIVAGDQYLVFDAGEGAAMRLDNLGLPVAQVDAVFITHWHSDHFAGLGYLVNDSWVQGRRTPLPVYGPRGAAQIVGAFDDTYALDAHYRVATRADVLDARVRGAEAHELPDDPVASQTVYDKDGLQVSAFAVDHRPVEPAFGYRITWRGRVVVVSGDTRATSAMIDAARGADVLVHEALDRALLDRAIAEARRMGLDERAHHMEAITSYHADSVALAKLAESAGVKKLVVTHLIPPTPPNVAGDWIFRRAMRPHFHGDLVVGRDGMVVTL